MAHEALYFPYIEVPDKPSLTRVLLYWDRLGTIVPWSVPDLSERMRELVAAELVERVVPEEEVSAIDDFADGFLALLRASPRRKRAGPGVARIHYDKGTGGLWSELERRELAREGDGGWMEVDAGVAALYMAYLASCLGRKLGREPITDQREALAGFTAAGRSEPARNLERMRAIVLKNVLPAPAVRVPPREIAAFKEKHWDKLGTFRTHVERRLLEHVRERAPEIRRRALELTAAEFEEGAREIEALMKPRWPSKRGVLCAGLAGLPAGGQATSELDPFAAAGAVTPMVVEVVDALLGRPPGELANSPLAYAALAAEAFGEGRSRASGLRQRLRRR